MPEKTTKILFVNNESLIYLRLKKENLLSSSMSPNINAVNITKLWLETKFIFEIISKKPTVTK